ncbi:MAG: hypothetical protein Q8M40_02515, partial [Legionella sp.]|nr:hypothetical protein [Legionella sp.]
NQQHIQQIKDLLANNPHAAVITWPELVDALRQQLSHPLIFTGEQVLGLEYQDIIWWQPLEPASFAQLNVEHMNTTATELKAHKPKKATHNTPCERLFNTLYVGASRTTNNLIIVQQPTHKLKPVLTILENNSNTNNTNQQSEPLNAPQNASVDNTQIWESELFRQIEAGNQNTALEIFSSYLKNGERTLLQFLEDKYTHYRPNSTLSLNEYLNKYALNVLPSPSINKESVAPKEVKKEVVADKKDSLSAERPKKRNRKTKQAYKVPRLIPNTKNENNFTFIPIGLNKATATAKEHHVSSTIAKIKTLSKDRLEEFFKDLSVEKFIAFCKDAAPRLNTLSNYNQCVEAFCIACADGRLNQRVESNPPPVHYLLQDEVSLTFLLKLWAKDPNLLKDLNLLDLTQGLGPDCMNAFDSICLRIYVKNRDNTQGKDAIYINFLDTLIANHPKITDEFLAKVLLKAPNNKFLPPLFHLLSGQRGKKIFVHWLEKRPNLIKELDMDVLLDDQMSVSELKRNLISTLIISDDIHSKSILNSLSKHQPIVKAYGRFLQAGQINYKGALFSSLTKEHLNYDFLISLISVNRENACLIEPKTLKEYVVLNGDNCILLFDFLIRNKNASNGLELLDLLFTHNPNFVLEVDKQMLFDESKYGVSNFSKLLTTELGRNVLKNCLKDKPELFEDRHINEYNNMIIKHNELIFLSKEKLTKRHNGVNRINQECRENFPRLIAALTHHKDWVAELVIEDFFDESIAVDTTRDMKQQRKDQITSLLKSQPDYTEFLNLIYKYNPSLFQEFTTRKLSIENHSFFSPMKPNDTTQNSSTTLKNQ